MFLVNTVTACPVLSLLDNINNYHAFKGKAVYIDFLIFKPDTHNLLFNFIPMDLCMHHILVLRIVNPLSLFSLLILLFFLFCFVYHFCGIFFCRQIYMSKCTITPFIIIYYLSLIVYYLSIIISMDTLFKNKLFEAQTAKQHY